MNCFAGNGRDRSLPVNLKTFYEKEFIAFSLLCNSADSFFS